MKQHFSSINAQNSEELRAELARIEIGVVRRPERRTHASRECYSVARMLATILNSNLLSFPLQVEFRDGPDVALHMQGKSIGVECTDAIAEEWAEILDLRASDFPRAIISLPRLKPGLRTLTQDDIRAYASGTKFGPPWVGKEVEQDWAKAMIHYVSKKLEKLRSGAYSEYSENWLLVHDEWVMHPASVAEQQLAASLLAREHSIIFSKPCFTRLFIESSNWLTFLTEDTYEVRSIVDLWN